MVFVCSRSFYLVLKGVRGCLLFSISAVWKRYFNILMPSMLSLRYLFGHLPEYVYVIFNRMKGNFSRVYFSRYFALIKLIFDRLSGVFFICDKFPSVLHLVVFIYLYLSIYFYIMLPQVCFSTCRSRKCVH